MSAPTDPRSSSWLDSGVTLVVAVVAAAASYGHMLHVAHLAGEPLWIARAWPITVDGLAIAALRRGERGRPWLLLALAVSIASNVLAGYPEMVDTIAPAVKAWPPLALFGCHVLLHAHPAKTVPAPGVVPAVLVDDAPPAASSTTGAGQPGHDAPTTSQRRGRAPAPTKPRKTPARPGAKATPPVMGVVELVPVARKVAADLAAQGRNLTRDTLVTGLRAAGHPVSNRRAGELLALLRENPTDPTAGPTPAEAPRRSLAALPAPAEAGPPVEVEAVAR